jgi:hypothetical protein
LSLGIRVEVEILRLSWSDSLRMTSFINWREKTAKFFRPGKLGRSVLRPYMIAMTSRLVHNTGYSKKGTNLLG